MADRKEYEMLYRINAEIGSSYKTTFNNAQATLASMQKEISALSKVQSDISAYQKQDIAVDKSKQRLELLQKQYDNIQKEMRETGEFSSTLENKLLSKQQQIDKAAASLEAQTAKLNQMGDALRNAGVDTQGLTGETAKLASQIDELKKKQEEAAEKAKDFGSSASASFSAAGQALAAAGMTALLKKAYDEFKDVTDAAMEFESVMASVRRTVGGSKEEIDLIGDYFQSLSEYMPIATSEIGKIAETAGQLGIAKDRITDFVEVMAMLGTTTNLSAESAATLLAQFANITGLTDYRRLGSTVAQLGDATATTASKVVEMSQGMAAAASIAGFSETDILALAAAVGSLGIESQAGSTAMSMLISTLYKAVETGSDKLISFAEVAGMSANEFAAAWKNNAVNAMNTFIKGLNDTEQHGKSAIVILDELGISNVRQTKAILGLANADDLLTETIAQANKAWEENTALTDKAGIMYGTTQSQLIMMQNAFNGLKITMGEQFTPELQKLYSEATKIIKGLNAFVEKNPELIKGITGTTTAVVAATGALLGYSAAVKLIKSLELATVFTGPAGAIMYSIAGIAAVTATLLRLNEAYKNQTSEAWELTAASRQEYNALKKLNEEYEQSLEEHEETSYQVWFLRGRLEKLTAEYENSKQSLEEYKQTHDALLKSYSEMSASYAAAAAEIDKEEQSTYSLIAKLRELTEATDGAATNKEAILSIIQALNSEIPELVLNYDDVTNSTEGFIDSLYAIARVKAEQSKLEQQWASYIYNIGEQEALKNAKEAAEYNAKIVQEEYNLALKIYEEASARYSKQEPIARALGTREEQKILKAAQEQLKVFTDDLYEASQAYEENVAAISKLEGAFKDYQQAQEDAAISGANFSEVVKTIKAEMDELSAAYEESYNAALESVSGQYKLWDEAKEIVAVSASEIAFALETQAEYWNDYNQNLAALTDRSSDIEGLADLISNFADGSEGSVNAIAGMAGATNEELESMVTNWQRLQSEQKTVADSLAKLEAEFSASMDAIQAELEETIAAMNLSDEAALSGKSTVEGFIKGSESMLPAVSTAYAKIVQAAKAAIDAQLEIQGPLSDLNNLKTKSFPETVSANPGGQGGNTINLTFSPQFDLSGETNASDLEGVIRKATYDMKDMLIDLLEDVGIEKSRRAYK